MIFDFLLLGYMLHAVNCVYFFLSVVSGNVCVCIRIAIFRNIITLTSYSMVHVHRHRSYAGLVLAGPPFGDLMKFIVDSTQVFLLSHLCVFSECAYSCC